MNAKYKDYSKELGKVVMNLNYSYSIFIETLGKITEEIGKNENYTESEREEIIKDLLNNVYKECREIILEVETQGILPDVIKAQ